MPFRSRTILRSAPLAAALALAACAAPAGAPDSDPETRTASAAVVRDVPIGDLPDFEPTPGVDHSFTMPTRWSFPNPSGTGRTDELTLMGDVNGDGKKDFVRFVNEGTWLGLSDGTRFVGGIATADFGRDQGWVETADRRLIDLDGDGKDDLVGFFSNGIYVAMSTGTGFGPTRHVSSDFVQSTGWGSLHRKVFADFDRDGRKDIIGFGPEGTYIALQDASGTFGAPRLALRNFGEAQGWFAPMHDHVLVDLNGDGRPDIVGFGDAGVWWSFAIGIGYTQPSFVLADFGVATGWNSREHERLVVDFDGDGIKDIVGFGQDGVWAARFNGVSFEQTKRLSTYFARNTGFSNAGVRALVDLNGDGYLDILGENPSSDEHVLYRALGGPGGTFGPQRAMLRTRAPETAIEQSIGGVFVADVDNDGLPDFVAMHAMEMRVALSKPTPPPPVPKGPTGARIVSMTNDAVKVAWNDNSTDERAFRVFFQPGHFRTAPANVTSLVIDDLLADKDYCFDIQAEGMFGLSPLSTRVCGHTPPGLIVPPPIPNDWQKVCGVGPSVCPAGFHAVDYGFGPCAVIGANDVRVENATVCAPNGGTFLSCGTCPALYGAVAGSAHYETSCALPGVTSTAPNAFSCWRGITAPTGPIVPMGGALTPFP